MNLFKKIDGITTSLAEECVEALKRGVPPDTVVEIVLKAVRGVQEAQAETELGHPWEVRNGHIIFREVALSAKDLDAMAKALRDSKRYPERVRGEGIIDRDEG